MVEEGDIKMACVKKWVNTNRLLDKGWEGVKTGFTASAGSCLSSLREGIFIVVLNSQDDSSRFTDTQKVYEWYQDHLSDRQAKSVLTVRPPLEVKMQSTKT
jgi:D-alanyl-D-alanine carboxypeptidase